MSVRRWLVSGVVLLAAGSAAAEFRVEAEATSGGQTFTSETVFVADAALEVLGGEPSALFVLNGDEWHDKATLRGATLEDSEAWLRQTVERTRASAAKQPDSPQKTFALAMVEPNLEVTESDGKLTFSNAIVTMVVEVIDPPAWVNKAQLYEAERLNTYRKAMVQQQPPFVTLELLAELERRGKIPASISMAMSVGDRTTEAKVVYRYVEQTSEELKASLALIDRYSR